MVEPAIQRKISDFGMGSSPSWTNKIIQTYEMHLVRHSLMLVGPSGTGKSRIVETLQAALQQIVVPPDAPVPPMIGQPQKHMTMNPKVPTKIEQLI